MVPLGNSSTLQLVAVYKLAKKQMPPMPLWMLIGTSNPRAVRLHGCRKQGGGGGGGAVFWTGVHQKMVPALADH